MLTAAPVPALTPQSRQQTLLNLTSAGDRSAFERATVLAATNKDACQLTLENVGRACETGASPHAVRLGVAALHALESTTIDGNVRDVLHRAAIHPDRSLSGAAHRRLKDDSDTTTIALLAAELSSKRDFDTKLSIAAGLVSHSLPEAAREQVRAFVRDAKLTAESVCNRYSMDLIPLIDYMDPTVIAGDLVKFAAKQRSQSRSDWYDAEACAWQALQRCDARPHLTELCSLYKQLPERAPYHALKPSERPIGAIAAEVLTAYARERRSIYQAMLSRWDSAPAAEKEVIRPIFNLRAADAVLGYCIRVIEAAPPVKKPIEGQRAVADVVGYLYGRRPFRDAVRQLLTHSDADVDRATQAIVTSGFADNHFVRLFSKAISAENFSLVRSVDELIGAAEDACSHHRHYALKALAGMTLDENQLARVVHLAKTETYHLRDGALQLLEPYSSEASVRDLFFALHAGKEQDVFTSTQQMISEKLAAQINNPSVLQKYIELYSGDTFTFNETYANLLIERVANPAVRSCCVRLLQHREASWSAYTRENYFHRAPFAFLPYVNEPEVLSALLRYAHSDRHTYWNEIRDGIANRIHPGDPAYTALFTYVKTHNSHYTSAPLQILVRSPIAADDAYELVKTIANHGYDVEIGQNDYGLIDRLKNRSKIPGTSDLIDAVQRALADDDQHVGRFALDVLQKARIDLGA